MSTATATGSRLRLLPPSPVDLADHVRRHGRQPGAQRVLAEVTDAGLTGRGGGAFPLGRKIAAVLAAPGRPIVVGNGAEGEPASGKDRALLLTNPHLVLDGLQLVAAATGADEAHLSVRADPDVHHRLTGALADRGYAGVDLLPVELTTAAPGFVSGQESALLRQLAGGPALPSYQSERVTVRGLRGRPTLVSNVESLAHLALIARYGADWFRSEGTAREAGTMLATVWPAGGTPFVAEYALGTPLADVLGPPAVGTSAVLIGGYHGVWLPSGLARTRRLSAGDLRQYGAAPGAGVVAELAADRCGVAETARLVEYLAAESVGQCGPCLNGLPRIAGALRALTDGTAGSGVLKDLRRWSGLVQGRGACAHPDGSVRLVGSALSTFEREVALHLRGGCSATDHRPFLPVGGGLTALDRRPLLASAAVRGRRSA